jgi:hypothetical protein
MDLKALQEKYMTFLTEEGYKSAWNSEYEAIMFQFRGSNYGLEFEESHRLNRNGQFLL